MNEEALNVQEAKEMSDNRFQTAGWLAIVSAILFPLGIIIKIGQGLLGFSKFRFNAPTFGPGEIVFLVYLVFIVYVLLMFRKLLNERYNLHDLDVLILISIWWGIFLQAGPYVLWGLLALMSPVSEAAIGITYFLFMAVAMITIGVVDILIAVKLLKIKETLNDLLKTFAIISLAAGICELTVILSPISWILTPVSCIIIGMMLLREDEGLEFV
ncbi:MAG: hypothetical protein JRI35_09630 [Deltaproteobacteria bacterium]|nr:hypothetical protein [Deltaproteobacteria bacterium]